MDLSVRSIFAQRHSSYPNCRRAIALFRGTNTISPAYHSKTVAGR